MTNANDSAFTYSEISWNKDDENYNSIEHSGLTKREYFAAMAMQGILSAQAGTREMVEMQAEYYASKYENKTMIEAIAAESTIMSDSLIKALNENQ